MFSHRYVVEWYNCISCLFLKHAKCGISLSTRSRRGKLLTHHFGLLWLWHRSQNMTTPRHTYLAQGRPWSARRFPQAEAPPLHFGWVDACDHNKCLWLGCVIFVSGGLRSRYPSIRLNTISKNIFLGDAQQERCYGTQYSSSSMQL